MKTKVENELRLINMKAKMTSDVVSSGISVFFPSSFELTVIMSLRFVLRVPSMS